MEKDDSLKRISQCSLHSVVVTISAQCVCFYLNYKEIACFKFAGDPDHKRLFLAGTSPLHVHVKDKRISQLGNQNLQSSIRVLSRRVTFHF